MDIQLEILKGMVMELAAKIEESNGFKVSDVETDTLYEIAGKIDDIKEDYEQRVNKIKELL